MKAAGQAEQVMNEQDQLISDISRLCIHIKRLDILRFIRSFIVSVMKKEGLDPESILDDEH